MGQVAAIVRHPAVWPHVRDERAPEAWEPTDDAGIYWMLISLDSGAAGGLFSLQETAPGRLEMHTCLLPEAWGVVAKRAAKMLGDWAFYEFGCTTLASNVPAYNRLALRFAKAGGMRETGNNPASFMKNGVLHDQVLLSVTNEEWKSCR